MNITVNADHISVQEIESLLKKTFPEYIYKIRGTRMLVVKRSPLIAGVIVLKKKSIRVNGNFPEYYLSMIFALITVAFGILIPVLLYFIFIHGRMKKIEKELYRVLKAEYSRS